MKHLTLICVAMMTVTGCAVAQETMNPNQSEIVPQATGLRTVVGCLSRTAQPRA